MDGWEDFITGGNDGLGEGTSIPTFQTTAEKKTISAYCGIAPIGGVDASELPIRAFNKIYNQRYRDQDLLAERPETNNQIPFCAWEKDYFTTARPFTQRGPDVSLPIGGEIRTDVGVEGGISIWSTLQNGYRFMESNDVTNRVQLTNDAAQDVANMYLAETDVSVNEFRAAFAIQRYQEARARYGARFTEYLRYCGITPSDARLQEPEFLGGGTARLNFSEVLQTAPTDATGGPEEAQGIGDLFGHGIAGVRSRPYRKFFEEHGYVMTLCSIRPKAIYMNGTHREFLKTTKEDFFQKELSNLGQQEVYQAELYSENERDVFGFQDRYHEYRSHPSNVVGDFRDLLNSWHLARELQADVTLNGDFINCDPSDRIFQVGNDVADTCWVMANHHIVARRMVPKRANPRII